MQVVDIPSIHTTMPSSSACCRYLIYAFSIQNFVVSQPVSEETDSIVLLGKTDDVTVTSATESKDPRLIQCNVDSDLATLPLSIDCKGARDNLPEESKRQSFYNGSFVPAAFIYNTCFISVTMIKGLEEWTSWLDIKIAASMIIGHCKKGSRSAQRTGGTVNVGSENRLKVEVKRWVASGTVGKNAEDVEKSALSRLH